MRVRRRTLRYEPVGSKSEIGRWLFGLASPAKLLAGLDGI